MMNFKIGMVNFPVMLVNLVNVKSTSSLSLHRFSKCCNSRTGYNNYCKKCQENINEFSKGIDKDTILSKEQEEKFKEYLDNGIIEVLKIEKLNENVFKKFFPYILKSQLILPSMSKKTKTETKLGFKTYFSFIKALGTDKYLLVKKVERGKEHLGLIFFYNDTLTFFEIPFNHYYNNYDVERLKEAVKNVIEIESLNDLNEFETEAKGFIGKFKNLKDKEIKEEKAELLKVFVEELENPNKKVKTIKKEVKVNPFSK